MPTHNNMDCSHMPRGTSREDQTISVTKVAKALVAEKFAILKLHGC